MARPSTAADIMTTEVLSVDDSQSMQSVAEMLEVFRFRHMPVTDDGGLLGLLSQRDVLRASASSASPRHDAEGDFLGQTLRVKDIMSTDLHTVRPDTPLEEVAKLMHGHKHGCIPVITGHNTLVGLITEADFVRLAIDLLRTS